MNDPGLLVFAAIVLGASAFLLTMISTNAAIVLLIVSMLLSPEIPFGRLTDRAVVVRFDDLLLGVIFFTWLAKLAINKQLKLIRATPLNLPLACFVVCCLASTGWGLISGTVERPLASFFYLLKYVEFFVLYFMVANVVHERRQVALFLGATLVTALVVGLFGYAQLVASGTAVRITAPFEGKGEPNTLAGYLVLIMAVCIAMALYAKTGPKRVLYAGLALFFIPPFIFTYSRGGYLAFIVMFVALCFFSERSKPLLLAILLVGLLAAPLVLPSTVFQRIESTFDPLHGHDIAGLKLSGSPAARVYIWRYALEQWMRNPVLGMGITGLGFIDGQYALVLGELGLLGFVVFCWLRWRTLIVALRALRETVDPMLKGLSLGFAVGYIGLLVHALAGNVFIIVRIMGPYWLLAAMVTVLPELAGQPAPAPAQGLLTRKPLAAVMR